ncbi:hypothetical protein PHYBLDRAFT_163805 [Phycomyces blakesleeanus NRRL 1555(-)]|uniref:Uncharacterized protein n=1 Tax=Phycomyces blakesleeanus (strain ATCC 8743b / DSM 1359 / FGSC 10004 / NBRC 33097 / NRRL 1555) TaxID=763407 RepID=A0A162UXY3_PHYB8|nr:hypothetical protein PHYBLDRAFT_163805 [Phycomyces blakesleeanus NRRL 1555(-)]OAD78712.1 hypothetical protein PHYBLDRAFT_163805 [Phycomyces blakesleeanus NRRL 1555(-)]|eukprot:XP_018296752.1 hypothetical protein PHYBLDRAFT_163805 [Phycomyces blakesleeanus NRRL 1555(-)]
MILTLQSRYSSFCHFNTCDWIEEYFILEIRNVGIGHIRKVINASNIRRSQKSILIKRIAKDYFWNYLIKTQILDIRTTLKEKVALTPTVVNIAPFPASFIPVLGFFLPLPI